MPNPVQLAKPSPHRITTAASNKKRPTRTVIPKQIAQYTECLFLIKRIAVNANDTTNITTQCTQGT